MPEVKAKPEPATAIELDLEAGVLSQRAACALLTDGHMFCCSQSPKFPGIVRFRIPNDPEAVRLIERVLASWS